MESIFVSKIGNRLKQTYLQYDSLMINSLQNTNLTLSHLHKETGISRNTLRKMKEGVEGCTFNIAPYRRYKLFSCFFNLKILRTNYPHFIEIFDESKSNGNSNKEIPLWDADLSSNQVFNDIFAQEMKDPMAILIYAKSLDNGFSKKELVEEYGSHGLKIADKLVRSNLIAYHNEKFTAINSNYVDVEKGQIKEIIISLSQNYNPSHCGQEKNWINFRIAKINSEALRRIQNLHAELSSQIQDILSEPESKGSIPFYTINEMDTFEP